MAMTPQCKRVRDVAKAAIRAAQITPSHFFTRTDRRRIPARLGGGTEFGAAFAYVTMPTAAIESLRAKLATDYRARVLYELKTSPESVVVIEWYQEVL